MTGPKTFRNENLDHLPYMEDKTHTEPLRTSGLQPTSWTCFGGSWEQDRSQPSTHGSWGIAEMARFHQQNKKTRATWVWCMFHAWVFILIWHDQLMEKIRWFPSIRKGQQKDVNVRRMKKSWPFMCCFSGYVLCPSTKTSIFPPLKPTVRPFQKSFPKGKLVIPTIHFQVRLLLLVSGRVSMYLGPKPVDVLPVWHLEQTARATFSSQTSSRYSLGCWNLFFRSPSGW